MRSRSCRRLVTLSIMILVLCLFQFNVFAAAAGSAASPAPGAAAAVAAAASKPPPASGGKVLLLGGAIKNGNSAIFNAMRDATGKAKPSIAVFCSAASSLSAAAQEYESAYRKLLAGYGFDPVFIPIAVDNYLTAAVSDANVALVNGCDAAFFNGGWQERHVRCLYLDDAGTPSPLLLAVKALFDRGGVVAGTSAGCAAMGEWTYGDGTSYGYLRANGLAAKQISDINTADPDDPDNGGFVKGLGFLGRYGALADSHFMALGRFARPLVAMRDLGLTTAIGVDENTGFLLAGDEGTVIGANGVTVFDASQAVYGSGPWFSASGIQVSCLTAGDRFRFTDRTVLTSKPAAAATGRPYSTDSIFKAYEAASVMTALVRSSAASATGITPETDPRFTVTFGKTAVSMGYYDPASKKTTVARLSVSIG